MEDLVREKEKKRDEKIVNGKNTIGMRGQNREVTYIKITCSTKLNKYKWCSLHHFDNKS